MGRKAFLRLCAPGKTDDVGADAAAGRGFTCRYVGFNAAHVQLLDDNMLNAVLVLLVVTSVLGPILTELFTPGMIRQEAGSKIRWRPAQQAQI